MQVGSSTKTAAFGFAIMLTVVVAAACRGGPERNDDGSFDGEVVRVWSDGMRLETTTGTITVDTWAVCGDDTPLHIDVGDVVTVSADRDIISWDARRIWDSEGENACPR